MASSRISDESFDCSQTNKDQRSGRMKTTEPQDDEAQAAGTQQHDDTACMHKLLEVFRDKEVENLKMKLARDNLRRLSYRDKNMPQYITESMLEMRSAVDRFLCDLGPGPVVEASDAGPARDTAAIDTLLSAAAAEPGLRD